MKKAFAIAFLVLFTLVLKAEAGEFKIAYADLQRALNECDAGVKAKDELKKEAQKIENELSARQDELKKLKDEIDKKGSLWNKDTKDAKEKDLETKSQALQKEFMRYGDELNKKRGKREEEIIRELKDIVRDIAKEKGYAYVLEYSMGGIIYGPQDADMTKDVIETHNKGAKK
ncbi:MAG: OmpH family outer membrane protein [Deltaproteobacteria bacterium]|nr:OmpH family outer membrane protein [Deltaproteobacteria bacterium]